MGRLVSVVGFMGVEHEQRAMPNKDANIVGAFMCVSARGKLQKFAPGKTAMAKPS
jgi:hypothetical protein